MKHILSISGGGIRGVIPCSAVAEIERQTGKPAYLLFDYLAGTSTGALLAAGLACGIPAKDLLEVYTKRAGEIFTPAAPIATARLLLSGAWSASSMYRSANIAKVMRSIGIKGLLNDLPIRILLTAKGWPDRHPWYFVKDRPQNAKTTGHLALVDCAAASAAAPVYFDPFPVAGIGLCVDGGVGVTGNPVHQACIEAFTFDDFSPSDTHVLAMGTGFYPGTPSLPANLIDVATWTLDAVLSAPEDEQTWLVNQYYPGVMTYLDWPLPRPIDMADTSAIPDLVAVGRRAAQSQDWVRLLGLN